MSDTYTVVMTGKIADGESLDDVKVKVARLFKVGGEQLDKIFCGKPVAVRRGVDQLQADKICAALLNAGAVAKIKADRPAEAAVATTNQAARAATVQTTTAQTAAAQTAAAQTAAAQTAAAQTAAAQTAAAEEQPAAAESGPVAVESREAAAREQASAGEGEEHYTPDLECPRCGHEQPFTHQCGLCKMDLTLHIQRLRRKEQRRAYRLEQLKQAAG